MFGNRNLAVGIFVTVALVLFIGFTIWITGKRGTEETVSYTVLFKRDVSGLMLGGPVMYMGVEVGEVVRMNIVPGDPVNIRVDIEVLENTPVDAGTYATLQAQGITGVSVINLGSDPGQHPPLTAPPGEDHPVIPYRETGFSAIMSSAPAILDKLDGLLGKANDMLREENLERVSRTLDNVETISRSLASQEQAFQEIPEALKITLADIRSLLDRVQVLLDDTGPRIRNSFDNVEEITATVADLTRRLDAWLQANEDEVGAFMGKGLGQVPKLIEDARSMTRQLEKLLKILQQDPSALVRQGEEDAVEVEE